MPKKIPQKKIKGSYSVKMPSQETKQSHIESEIRSAFPEILDKFQIPFTIDQFQVKAKYFSSFNHFMKGNITDALFSIDFESNPLQLNGTFYQESYDLIFNQFEKSFLKVALSHEALHYKVTQTPIPLRVGFPTIPTLKNEMLGELIYDMLKDQIVFKYTPSKIQAAYQCLKYLIALLNASVDRSQLMKLITCSQKGNFQVKMDFFPIVIFPLLLGDLGKNATIFVEMYSQTIDLQAKYLLGHGLNLLNVFYSEVREKANFPSDLSSILMPIYACFLRLPNRSICANIEFDLPPLLKLSQEINHFFTGA